MSQKIFGRIALVIFLGLVCFNGIWTKPIQHCNLALAVPEMNRRHDSLNAELVVNTSSDSSTEFTSPDSTPSVPSQDITHDKVDELPKTRLGVKTLKLTIGSSAQNLKLPGEIDIIN